MRVLAILLLLSLFPPLVTADSGNQVIFAGRVRELTDLSIEELLNVRIITASRIEEKSGDVPASVVVVGRSDIEKYGYRTLAEILQNIPGVYGVEHYYREGVALGMRGFWSGITNKHIMILVDGIPQRNDYMGAHALPDIAVPVEAIERIEVVRGAMSVMYGSGAFFGVINIVTESPENKNTRLATVSMGDNNTKKAFMRLANTLGELQYTVNLSHYRTRGITASLDKLMLQSDWEAQERDYNNHYVRTMRGTLENQETFFNSILKYHNWTFLANYTFTNQESAFYTPPVANGSDNPRHTIKLGMMYEKQWSDTLTTQARLYYTDYRLYSDMELVRPGYLAVDDVSTKQFHAETNIFWQPSEKLKLAAGLTYDYLAHYSASTDSPLAGFFHTTDTTPNEKPQAWDAFAQTTYSVTDSLKLIAGLRFHQTLSYHAQRTNAFGLPNQTIVTGQYAEDDIRVIPRLAGLWRLNERHLFKLLYGESIVDIATQQNTNQFAKNLPALTLENINTTELAYIGSFQKVGVTASLFRNQLDNLIVRTNVINLGAVDSKRYMMVMNNSGKMRTYGAELTVQLRPSESWQLELSGTYQKTRDKKLDMPAAYSPNFLGYAKAAYQISPNQTIAAMGRYVGSMMPLYDESTQKRLGNTVDGYTVLDVNYRRNNVFTKGLFIDLRVANLLNEEIRYPVFSNNSWATLGTVGEDRTFLVTVGMKF